MTRARVNSVSAAIPLIFSGAAFIVVIANIIAGVPPKPDEDASAHIWQLLMAAQLPVIAAFVATSDWQRWRRVATVLAAQVLAIIAAVLPVWLAGY